MDERDQIDEVMALELELLDPACRADPERVAALLAEDFTEIGKSGRVWSRTETITALADDPGVDGITISDVRGDRVAAGVAVVRYRTHHADGPATVHRSGWWRETATGWRCWFHQATVVPEATGEAAVVAAADGPTTQADIEAALDAAGVRAGATVIVHCALSRLGWVAGNAAAVVGALRSVVGGDGTIVMPAQTGIGDPLHWQEPAVPETWWPTIREHWPVFDAATAPLRAMGAVAECFARHPGVVFSGHPSVGFMALGPRSVELLHPHPLHDGFGEASPLARLYDEHADVVLLGVGHDNNTALHLAETRALGDRGPMTLDGAPLVVDGRRAWVDYTHLDYDADDFEALGDAYVAAGGTERRVALGAGELRRCPMPELVDFAVGWLSEHRRGAGASAGSEAP